MRFNQVEFKTPKHGKDHGLPVGTNGKTPKTESNAIGLRHSLLNMANRETIIWYTDGQYQGGTNRGIDCMNLFDPKTNVIAVYQKQPDGSNLFLTTYKLNIKERDHLNVTDGNFEIDAPFNPMDGNLSQNPGFTPTNSFENDVRGITPMDNSQSNNP